MWIGLYIHKLAAFCEKVGVVMLVFWGNLLGLAEM